MATAVAAAYFARYGQKLCVAHKQAELFENNPYLECFPEYAVQNLNDHTIKQAEAKGDQLIAISYLVFDEANDKACPTIRSAPSRNMLARMAERVGLSGDLLALPRIYLSEEEKRFGNLFGANQIAIATQGIEKYKTWGIKKMETVIQAFPDYHFIQLGAPGDTPIKGAKYLCGQLTLRQTAATLYNSRCYAGPQGALIHLARAVDCPAIIINPSAEPYSDMSYPEYQAVSPEHPCPYCTSGGMFFENCEYPERCMEDISAQKVIKTLENELSHARQAKAGTVHHILPDPANDLLDYHRQYDSPHGILKTILVTRTDSGGNHATFRSMKIAQDATCSVIVQFNRASRFSSLLISDDSRLVFTPCGATIWRENQSIQSFNADYLKVHDCLKINDANGIWHLPRKPLAPISFARKLDMQDGDKLVITFRTKTTQELVTGIASHSRMINFKLKLASCLAKLSKIYDNRWTRRLWDAGY